MSVDIASSVKKKARQLGADKVGVASSASFANAPEGHRPDDLLKGARSVVVVAVAIPKAVFESAPSREYAIAYLAANRELDRIAFQLSRFLEARGYRSVPVPASPPYDLALDMGDLSHRHAGVIAGLGVFGKNSLLLSPDFGPRTRLASVVTEAPIKPDKPMDEDFCGTCTRCLIACPAKALKEGMVVDKASCNEEHMDVGRRLQLHDWEQVCGVCIKVCPVGKK